MWTFFSEQCLTRIVISALLVSDSPSPAVSDSLPLLGQGPTAWTLDRAGTEADRRQALSQPSGCV